MGHTSKWQIWVQWSHFWRLLVSVDFDGLSTKLIIIFIIELGIWVIRASGKFGCSGDTFQGCWLLWILMVYKTKLIIIFIIVDFDGLSTKLIIIFIIVLGIWVIRASGNLGCCSLGVIITLLHGREHRHRSQSALERFISFYTLPPFKFLHCLQ